MGTPLVAHPAVRAISFTGSDGVGKGIARIGAERLARVQLEMGGKNPTIVLADADLDVAVDCVLNAAFFSTGQRCTATSRAIVEKPIVERVRRAAASRKTEALKIGDPRDPATELGPAIDEQAARRRRCDYRRRSGKQEGATLVYGGERLSDGPHAHGWFSRPAIMTGVRVASRGSVRRKCSARCSASSRPNDFDDAVRARQRRPLRPVGVDLHDATSAARSSTSSAPRPA